MDAFHIMLVGGGAIWSIGWCFLFFGFAYIITEDHRQPRAWIAVFAGVTMLVALHAATPYLIDLTRRL